VPWTIDVTWSRRALPLQVPLGQAAISSDGSVCVGGRDQALGCQELEIFGSDLGPSQLLRGTGVAVDQDAVDEAGEDPEDDEWESEPATVAMGPTSMAWSPDGRFVVTGSANPERVLRMYDVAASYYLGSFGDHGGDLYNLAWSPQGHFVASASTWSRHQLKVWECESPLGRGLAIHQRAEVDHIYDYLPWWEHEWMVDDFYGFGRLSFSPDEEWLAVEVQLRTEKNRVAVYALPDLDDCFSFPLPAGSAISDMSWHSDGTHLLAADHGEGLLLIGPVSDQVAPRVKRISKNAYRCQVNPHLPFCAIAHRTGGSVGFVSDLELAPRHVIEILKLPEMKVVAQLRGCSSVRQLTWGTNGRDLYGLTAAAEVLRCHIVGGRWVDPRGK
jgi:hypothetical protein